MPLFEYHCDRCQSEFELLVRGNDSVRCPDCTSETITKLISSPAAVRATAVSQLPMAGECPPPQIGPCGPACCRVPTD
ncbi:FmdB family zinc ribbon protein [Stratiformator vulcanicus]|uniref:Zinc ribbon domain protein n=1 Tax=Stratiformator vulcanicus TaxID=2527980 RepID=A0A517R523_9PLAN|nr:Zinc ribbon domain protein [Stratiformator vulcanicus]